MTGVVLCEVRDGVMWITLNRPEKLNALNEELRRGLLRCLRAAEEDPGTRVVVIRGSGKAFSAGADLELLKKLSEAPREEVKGFLEELGTQKIGLFIRSMTKPVVAVVHGYCLGGGFELVQYCDLVYASEDAVFGQPEINVGLIPGGGGTQNLPRIIGDKRSRELVLTGKRISAREAMDWGIINGVFPREKLEEAVSGVINELKAKDPTALALAKKALNMALERPLTEGLALERELYMAALASEGAKAAIKEFLSKRRG